MVRSWNVCVPSIVFEESYFHQTNWKVMAIDERSIVEGI